MTTLYSSAKGATAVLLALQTTTGERFGAFITFVMGGLRPTDGCSGSTTTIGSSFLWAIREPAAHQGANTTVETSGAHHEPCAEAVQISSAPTVSVYRAIDTVVFGADSKTLWIGFDPCALLLRSSGTEGMYAGESQSSPIFGSEERLSSNQQFKVRNLEVWSILQRPVPQEVLEQNDKLCREALARQQRSPTTSPISSCPALAGPKNGSVSPGSVAP